MPRPYNKVHGNRASRQFSKTELIKRLTAEYGAKYTVGHISDFIDKCRTNGTFVEGRDYELVRSSKNGNVDTSVYYFKYSPIKPRLEEAVKARGVKGTYIYEALDINRQQFNHFRKKLETTLFGEGEAAHLQKIKELYPDPGPDIGRYYSDNFAYKDGKLQPKNPSSKIEHRFSEKMVKEMKVLYRILIAEKRGRLPKQKPPKATAVKASPG